MAYTNTWSTTIPAGTLAANQIDTAIQQTRLDIAQRINTILGSLGSMSTDPVLNGTTVKDLTVLTAELATKTTLTGLTNGVIPKATGAGTIGNSSLTEAALVATIATVAGLAAPVNLLNQTIVSGTLFNAPSAGLYLVVVQIRASVTGTQQWVEVTGGGQTMRQEIGINGVTFTSYRGNLCLLCQLANGDAVTITGGGAGVNSGVFSYVKLA